MKLRGLVPHFHIGTEATQLLIWKYINRILFAVQKRNIKQSLSAGIMTIATNFCTSGMGGEGSFTAASLFY
jgi:hypothetical protein